jgi:hypothetical protein
MAHLQVKKANQPTIETFRGTGPCFRFFFVNRAESEKKSPNIPGVFSNNICASQILSQGHTV